MVFAYLALFSIVMLLIGTLVSNITQSFLIDHRVREQISTADDIAVSVAPGMKNSNAQTIYETILDYGQNLSGRVLVLDKYGVVQSDSFSKLNGVSLEIDEINQVLNGNSGSANALHELEVEVDNQSGDTNNDVTTEKIYVMYYVSSIVYDGNMLGVIVLSLPVQDIFDQVAQANSQIMLVVLVASIIVIIISFLIAKVITKPITALTDIIKKMSKGEIHQRVKVTGKSELSQLGQAFNTMSEQLERVEENRNNFVSDVSHEIKTPLSSMKILVESLIYDQSGNVEMHKEFLGDINNEINRLSYIVNDLLQMVSMEQDRVVINHDKVNISKLTSLVFKAMTPIAERKEITLIYGNDTDAIVWGDKIKLQQAVTNLVDNAIKYTLPGGEVQVSVEEKELSVVIRIADTGIGIPEKEIPHLTERFYRVEKARSREAGGTGLGLSIVERIVKLHNGAFSITSEEGVGTTIDIILPRITDEDKEVQ